jgi:hypothetical protein
MVLVVAGQPRAPWLPGQPDAHDEAHVPREAIAAARPSSRSTWP